MFLLWWLSLSNFPSAAYFRSYFVLLLQDLMAWVNADNPVEVWVGSTPPALGRLEEVRRWQSQAIRVALHQNQGRTNRWVHIAGTGRSLKSWWPTCWPSCEPLIPQAGIQKVFKNTLVEKVAWKPDSLNLQML